MKNIVLIGLSGCGKSTVGALVARHLQLPFVDMDDYIEAKEGMTIPEIFEKKGEPYFRQAETHAAKVLSISGGKIIATGGGIVLNPDNMSALKENGMVLFLDRTPEAILKKINLQKRPLLAQNKNHLFILDRKRRPLYEKYADVTVLGESTVEQTVEQVLAALKPFISY